MQVNLIHQINFQLTERKEDIFLLKDLLNPITKLNKKLSLCEIEQKNHPELADIVEKISSLYLLVIAEHGELKSFSNELIMLDINTTILMPGIPEKWQPLIELLKTPIFELQNELERIPNSDDSDISEGLKEENLWLNRYSNVIPYNFNRVKLGKNGYISVSDVQLGKSRYLIGSAPVKDAARNTAADWWRMIIEENTRLIVAASNVYGYVIPRRSIVKKKIKIEKCFYYWQSKRTINQLLRPIKGWQCEKISNEMILKRAGIQKIIKRIITLNGPNDEIRKITHLQYQNWPDSGVADTKLAMKFQEIIAEEEAKFDTQKHPPLCHCSAGIGRIGVTMAIHLIMKGIKECEEPKELSIDVKDVIKTLRSQRANMVQTAPQVKMIARIALEALLYPKIS